jgi:hypothetical protein
MTTLAEREEVGFHDRESLEGVVAILAPRYEHRTSEDHAYAAPLLYASSSST